MVDYKKDAGMVDGTPVKRMIWSIINDYDLKTALCELVDNAIDQGFGAGFKDLTIEAALDVERQLISVRDDAGGVSHDDLHLLISPGGSKNDPYAIMIGIFGVGGKRSAIALAENIEIKTRFHDKATHELDINKVWLESDIWQIPSYQVPDIAPGTTEVNLSHLRTPITESDVDVLRLHLGETYSWFIQQGCKIILNNALVAPVVFDAWAFPPGQEPRQATFQFTLPDVGPFSAKITAGLIRDRVPEADNYGVYFYCNRRLIQKEVKIRDVGYFVSAEAGVPHPDSSLSRSIVQLEGPAKGMPWNSNKSAINFGHPAFQAMRSTVIDLTAHYSKLSRRLKDDWPRNVTQYDTGSVKATQAIETVAGRHLRLPDLPRESRPRGTKQKQKNQTIMDQKPWTIGLVEAIDAIDILERSQLETKNRIALLLLDSDFEIGLKEFIVHRTDLFPKREFPDAKIRQLFSNRSEVIKTVRAKIRITQDIIDLADHYYEMRNKFVHERATVDPSDSDILKYRSVVQRVLTTLFNLEFE